ncbi:MAG: hypothetical protein E7342_03320 [Clostridiales bacterium]|nr:hypothetical protein [Clostridiales bacterium]
MYFYFLASFKAVIKIDGEFRGTLDKNLAFSFENEPFIEICPLGEGTNISFILNESFLNTFQENLVITDLKGGYLLYFKRNFFKKGLTVLTQQNFSNALLTVYEENGLKVSIETKDDFFIESLFYEITEVKAEKVFLSKELLVVSFKGKDNFINVYSLFPKIENILSIDADEYQFNESFVTKKNIFDIKKHILSTTWGFSENRLFKVEEKGLKTKQVDILNLNEKVIPYLFLEDFLVNDDFEDYLDESLKEKKDLLKDYLGDFLGIMPPPSFIESNKIGLIYKKRENYYYVNYISFELFDRKIVNLKID